MAVTSLLRQTHGSVELLFVKFVASEFMPTRSLRTFVRLFRPKVLDGGCEWIQVGPGSNHGRSHERPLGLESTRLMDLVSLEEGSSG